MDDETRLLIQSPKPSDRSAAIDRLRLESSPKDLPSLRAARIAESIPSLRRRLAGLIGSLESPASSSLPSPDSGNAGRENPQFEEDAVHWIRHELEPGIGWLRLAASDEIGEYETSETRAAIDGLTRRVETLVALIRISAPPRPQDISLADVVDEAIATSGATPRRISIDASNGGDQTISTDPNLLRLALLNAIQNAFEAIRDFPDNETLIHIDFAVTPESFWVKVSNRFSGAEFTLDEVSASGVTAKIGHQGQGFNLMRLVSRRLGLKISLTAEGGVAGFTIRGPRRFGST